MKLKKQGITLFIAVLTVITGLVLAGPASALTDDAVLSQHIKEADGTSGQDTNSGSGVKTGHIQDGAVTDAKITGPISTSKLNVGTTPGTVAAGDHDHDSTYQKKYANVAVVAESGGDYTDPYTAMADYSTWCPNAVQETERCLLKIMPGIYDIGTNVVEMIHHIDIEGSGEGVTEIKGRGGCPLSICAGQVISGSYFDVELRSLTVEISDPVGNEATGIANVRRLKDVTVNVLPESCLGYPTGILYSSPGSPIEMTNVKVTVDSSCGTPYDNIAGINLTNVPSADLTNVRVKVTGSNPSSNCAGSALFSSGPKPLRIKDSEFSISNCYIGNGFEARYSNVTMTDSTVSGQYYGVRNISNSNVRIDHSSVYGGDYSISYSRPTYIAYSKVWGGPMYNLGGTLKCIGLYDDNYDPVTCP